jgi:hypothetical protein
VLLKPLTVAVRENYNFAPSAVRRGFRGEFRELVPSDALIIEIKADGYRDWKSTVDKTSWGKSFIISPAGKTTTVLIALTPL